VTRDALDRAQPKTRQTCCASVAALALLIASWICGCSEPGANVVAPSAANSGADEQVTTRGSVEVAAQLVEIPGKLIDDPLYNHAFIFKYQVITVYRGQIDAKQIAVAHYNPTRPRSEAQDEFNPLIGGKLRRFRPGDVHRMALEAPLDDHYIGPIVDRYHEEEKEPIYWALWTNGVNSR